METKVIKFYLISEQLLKSLGFKDDPQARMSHAEVMTFVLLAADICYGNYRRARLISTYANFFPKLLSESRLNKRMHQIPLLVWHLLFRLLSNKAMKTYHGQEFAVDSFPVASCQKCRIDRRKSFKARDFIGYSASKRKYFCGVKVHMIVTTEGAPIELSIAPGSHGDLSELWKMQVELPKGSVLYADGAYNSYELEDILLEDEGIRLLPKRSKVHRQRCHGPEVQKLISSRRQVVETCFSCITALLPRYIRYTSEKGFMLKLISAILVYSFSRLK